METTRERSKLVAGILAMFLGILGVHHFYMGETNKGITKLLITVLGSMCLGIGIIVTYVWSVVDAIALFNESANGDDPLGTKRSAIGAALLGISLGVFGIHNFYLGNKGKAIGQLLLGTVGICLCGIGPMISAIWGLIDGFLILTQRTTTDGSGQELGA